MSTFGIDHIITHMIQDGIDGAVARRTANYHSEIGEEVVELRPVNFVAWMGGVYLLAGIAFILGAVFELPSTMGCWMLVGSLCFLLIGIWLVRFRSRYRVLFNAQKLYLRPVFGEIRMFSIKDIASIGRSRNGKDLQFTMVSGKKVTISHYLIGLRSLTDHLGRSGTLDH